MASLTGSRFLFFTTSPRTPMKMVPEIEVLNDEFRGRIWNSKTQEEFMQALINEKVYEGKGPKDLSFAGRDRINRGPKSLGFVKLSPNIQLTDSGNLLVNSKRKEEVLLRQILKFQLPSPYHTKSKKEKNKFNIKPYLEIIRLIKKFGSLTFDEIMLFGLQLVDYNDFDIICKKIEQFRIEKAKSKGNYKKFRTRILREIILDLFNEDIKVGKTKLRESNDNSINNFIKTKSSTMRDYTDACFRYLRATGIVSISQRNKSISIRKEKSIEVDYFLKNIDREPVFIDNLDKYQEILFDSKLPVLYTDDRDNLMNQIIEASEIKLLKSDLDKYSSELLKDKLFDILLEKKNKALSNEIMRIKDYSRYDDIINTYKDIKNKDLYDLPLMLEWNTWRAMTMLDGGKIIANLNFDDSGEPMSTAIGNKADIVCDYEDFGVTVEVTLSSGARQYEMEGEPVTRHLANYKKEINKNAYCLFISPNINEACISHFFILHKLNIDYYGGKSIIVPLPLATFEKMLEDSFKSSYVPEPKKIEDFFKFSEKIAASVDNEVEWYEKINEKALNWLA